MLKFNWYSFSDLTTKQLYEILALRFDIFVLEQRCHYLDPDNKDFSAMHLLGTDNTNLVAYARLFTPNSNQARLIFGRVAIAKTERGRGYGKRLMQEILAYCDQQYPGIPVKCSAQYYLKKFYEDFGFVTRGDAYEDAGIPHIEMLRG